MKKFNLFKEIIVVNKTNLLNAINSNKPFTIDVGGKVEYEPFTNKAVIFKGTLEKENANPLNPNASQSLDDLFGKYYKIVEDGERILIKAFSNWQAIIDFNKQNASYDDTTADGVAEFSNKDLEEIGWHATEFNINYRSLVEVLEEKCDGIMLCIEQEEPYQFSGLGFLSDNEQAKEILYSYCQNAIKKLMAEDEDYAKENLEDDELEAAEFFGV
ncbi:hypothetical protein FJR48_02205 [Sulfurimonas lithotrophica]|uniref:Uncharacterized protein n=1 Tax=Sulfurimonas lithotrophica TaxID=2590022 RepID=A0A5P8NYV9_9BACT|nr:hypothetical protein [Sulfurimonas lithotrophica]QFR48601.1 hypothetical protein FJR48_02205 [Sulfurimonas lithotrophica]